MIVRLPRPWRAARSARWTPGVVVTLAAAGGACAAVSMLGVVVALFLFSLYGDRSRVPDIGPLVRFEFPTVGRIVDAHGEELAALSYEQRDLSLSLAIPTVVRDAILAAEDQRFFSHDGVDYLSLPRVATRIRGAAWVGHVLARQDDPATPSPTIFPQGGSTITQQLVRGVFLRERVAGERGNVLLSAGAVARAARAVLGTRAANMVFRKAEEMRLALWLEGELRRQFGSKRRAKDEILARYASLVYMGHGQYGFARAAEYYFGTPLAAFTPEDADRAALLAGIMKSPRAYAPSAGNAVAVLRRRNQVLALMAARGALTPAALKEALRRPLPPVPLPPDVASDASAVVEHVLQELEAQGLGLDDLLQGRVQVTATVDRRVQAVAVDALERGLTRYETRHPGARGLTQGAVVVLRNGDGAVLAETGGRRVSGGRAAAYGDFNRVRQAWRQPGSAMKPIVYLAAFRDGAIALDTMVPDEPISVPDGTGGRKWIANYDGRFKGLLPVRQAIAESRNAVAIWVTNQVGLDAVVTAARSLGLRAPLQPYVTTALGASEVTLLDLAGAYRAIASGLVVPPYVIREVTLGRTTPVTVTVARPPPTRIDDQAVALLQEGMRGVVRLPSGTAHALSAVTFPVAVMGKTGTTNDFRDALFIGSTYGEAGVTVGVRIGFDDNRSLGARETGGRVALPVFQDVMAGIYRAGLVGAAPTFPARLEADITRYLQQPLLPAAVAADAAAVKE